MSSEYAIEVSNLGKCYKIYDKPSDRLKQMLFRGRKQYYKEFWALRNVSFKVKKGETVGIIGRNGSGKSTLLQMIAGTLNPTIGEIQVNGKVAALLELGAGFNPEFTGVENVYMASSIYGLTKADVDQRFDAIAAFADIGDHIYQPVKTYSSGMYVRLAFAVIANVDAEILIIDEALAVGDAIFIQKCIRFIRGFKEKGTLIFVSHDMSSVLNLCGNALWLSKGFVEQSGPAKDISEMYLKYTMQELYGNDAQLEVIQKKKSSTSIDLIKSSNYESSIIDYQSRLNVTNNLDDANGWKSGAGEIISVDFKVLDDSQNTNVLKGGEIVKIVIKAHVYVDMSQPILGFLVRDKLGQDLFGENTFTFSNLNRLSVRAGEYIESEFIFKLPMLPNGDYTVMTSLADGDLYKNVQHHWLHNSLILHVASSTIRYGLVGIEFMGVSLNKK